MALKWARYDDVTGQFVASAQAPAPIAQDFDVGTGGQSNFVIGYPFTSSNFVSILVNGREIREGSDYVRNVALNRMEFSTPASENAWVRVKVHPA